MTATRIRCGVAGTGSLGQHHARIYSSLPGAELAGIFEPNDARAAESNRPTEREALCLALTRARRRRSDALPLRPESSSRSDLFEPQ